MLYYKLSNYHLMKIYIGAELRKYVQEMFTVNLRILGMSTVIWYDRTFLFFRVVANFLILNSNGYSYFPSINKFLYDCFTYELRYAISIENISKNLKIMNKINVQNGCENALTCYADLFCLTVCRVPLSRGQLFLRKVIRGISF